MHIKENNGRIRIGCKKEKSKVAKRIERNKIKRKKKRRKFSFSFSCHVFMRFHC